MGNMGYPVVTRIGLSQFWYKHWYSDSTSTYFFNFKQDLMFVQLFKTYLNYGLMFPSTLFFHELFLNKNAKTTRLRLVQKNLKYFRSFQFSNNKLGIEHVYLLRNRTGEYFPLRLWVLKYSNWILICFHCFKPMKKKLREKTIMKDEFYALSTNLQSTNLNFRFKRFKLVFLFFKKFLAPREFNYSF